MDALWMRTQDVFLNHHHRQDNTSGETGIGADFLSLLFVEWGLEDQHQRRNEREWGHSKLPGTRASPARRCNIAHFQNCVESHTHSFVTRNFARTREEILEFSCADHDISQSRAPISKLTCLFRNMFRDDTTDV
mmetsp:Transcript_3426/g.13033  ORF Transcript_3426/g.13033 Transcript_3426/m.13033 type:complete len:134 (-) Transcript_3426:1571-1972(-)